MTPQTMIEASATAYMIALITVLECFCVIAGLVAVFTAIKN